LHNLTIEISSDFAVEEFGVTTDDTGFLHLWITNEMKEGGSTESLRA
jgi:hypothetical protein